MPVERGNPAVCNGSNKMEGKGEMTNTPISLQDLRRSLYVKAKAEPAWRFWGLYVHVCGVTFEAIEESGVEDFLRQIRDDLYPVPRRSFAPSGRLPGASHLADVDV